MSARLGYDPFADREDAERYGLMLKQRNALLAALKTLATPPPGSAMVLGVHDKGPHFHAMQDAWNVAHDLIRECEQDDQ